MATGNHLTVRDYFDQVLVGRSAYRRGLSFSRTAGSDKQRFHHILESLGNQRLNHHNLKPTGLTVDDYLKNPILVKCQFNHQLASTGSKDKKTKRHSAFSHPASRAVEDIKAKSIARSGHINKTQRAMNPSTSAASQKETGAHVRLVIERSIYKAARNYDLPSGLIRGVIKAESNFQVNAVSAAGAQGLMQLMPGTARELGVDKPFDIERNIDGGARYLKKMLDSFDGDVKVALAAYNAGPGAVAKYGGQIPPYPETERYIDRVLKFSKQTA